jgi:hypothetical protein
MSGSSRSRQKHKLEPITLEELAGTTGMSGFGTLFTRDLSQAVPLLDAVDREEHSESSAPDIAAPESGALQSSAVERGALETGALKPGAPETPVSKNVADALLSGAPESTAPDLSAPEIDAPSQPTYRRPRIREAATVQDAHTLAEQAVYDAMYRAGRPHQGDSRILTIGLRTLAELSRMAYSNCKANVRSLIDKLALDADDDFSYTTGRTYIVYSFRDTLRRRKAAGLTHVIRTRGVVFVDPASGREVDPFYESSAPDSSAPESETSALESVQTGAPLPDESSAPVTDPHIRNRHLLRNSNETTAPSPLIVAAIQDAMGRADENAAQRITEACREAAPDVTSAEIAHFIRQEGPALRKNRALDNPMGVLIRHIPRCCRGESLRLHRQVVSQEEDRNRRQIDAWLRDARAILAGPDASATDRVWAEDILATYGAREGNSGTVPFSDRAL